jgi:hypothetical protein
MNKQENYPIDIEAERYVLGACVMDKTMSAFNQAASRIAAEDFSLDSHRKIFRAMCECADEGLTPDSPLLIDKLGGFGNLEKIGGFSYLTSLTDGLPIVKNIGGYVELVREKARARMLLNLFEVGAARLREDQVSGGFTKGNGIDGNGASMPAAAIYTFKSLDIHITRGNFQGNQQGIVFDKGTNNSQVEWSNLNGNTVTNFKGGAGTNVEGIEFGPRNDVEGGGTLTTDHYFELDNCPHCHIHDNWFEANNGDVQLTVEYVPLGRPRDEDVEGDPEQRRKFHGAHRTA